MPYCLDVYEYDEHTRKWVPDDERWKRVSVRAWREAVGFKRLVEGRVVGACYSCAMNQEPDAALPSRERVYDDGLWRVAHAISGSLSGWLVVVARRHVTSLSELTAAEAAALGPLLQRVSRALEQVLGVPKAYVIFFAEHADFPHVHIHVVPRPPDPDRRGSNVFAYMREPEDQWVTPAAMDQIADDLRAALVSMPEGTNL